ncbi:MAG: response regulator [Myxococcota bacterium]|nr:response regulator [Myxococcota bacterium]
MAQILVVDDSFVVREGIVKALQQLQVTVDTATDGVDALTKIKADSELQMVITDVNMPNMDGLQLAKHIHKELNSRNLKVIMCTTGNSPYIKKYAKAAGVRGWIVKPFEPDLAIPAIKKLLEL